METKDRFINNIKDLPIDLHSIFFGSLAAVIILGLSFAIWLLFKQGISSLERRAQLSPQLLLPIRLVVRYGIMIAALVLSISAFGIPIGNFWTFLSTILGLVAIGFVAVWSVLSNISSTFFLIGFKPFRVGDYVVLDDEKISGRVIQLDFMFTTLRRENGDEFKVPNNQFFQKAIYLPVNTEEASRERS